MKWYMCVPSFIKTSLIVLFWLCSGNEIHCFHLVQGQNINKISKLDVFKSNKQDVRHDDHLSIVKKLVYRITLCTFHCSNHMTLIVGKKLTLPHCLRLCPFCVICYVESEYPVWLTCPLYEKLRIDVLPKYHTTFSKLKQPLSSTNPIIVNCLAKNILVLIPGMKIRSKMFSKLHVL